MHAVIKYGFPSPGRIFYDLPLFEAHPLKHWYSVAWISIIESLNNGKLPNFYYLSFQPDNYNINYWSTNTFNENGDGLNDEQIQKINKLYFEMLDNLSIKERSIEI